MTRFTRFFPALFLITLLCAPHALKADIAPLQVRGGTVGTKSPHETIRMESEEVIMRLDKRSYTVEAVFRFYNSGETTTEWIGFPKGDQSFGAALDSKQPPVRPHGEPAFARPVGPEKVTEQLPDFIQFHGWVNGLKASFAEEDKRWMARHVTFPGGAITTIRVAYRS